MGAAPLLELFAKEHPAFVHVPLGAVVVLPLAMLVSFRSKASPYWIQTSLFLAAVGLAGSLVAMGSGLLWGRQIGLIPPRSFFPATASATQVLQRMLQLHEFAATLGVLLGSLCLSFLTRAWRDKRLPGGGHGRRFWDRGVGVPALLVSLIWLGAWGFCGKLGGIMVFGSEETNRAAAEAEARRKNDAEADLPIRALDFASLEPTQAAPFRSRAHGDRWARIWVPTSAVDAYRGGQPLSPGAYAVLSTVEDEHGKPGQDPGPLYFKEVLSDGKVAFAFYWPRVPEAGRAETGGEDSVYWRSPEPRLAACARCHRDAGPAKLP